MQKLFNELISFRKEMCVFKNAFIWHKRMFTWSNILKFTGKKNV